VLRLFPCLVLVACATPEPSVSPVVGPDGTRAFYVSCAGSEARCFRLAGESCPLGYDYAATPRRNLLVRCKDLMAPSPYAAFSDHAEPILENPFIDAGLAPNPYTSTPTPAPPSPTPPGTGLAPNPYNGPPAPSAPGSASFPPVR
jgi:hypothetical protein